MTTISNIPDVSYGILKQNETVSSFDEITEQVRNIGFAIMDGGYTSSELQLIREEFNRTRSQYIEKHGEYKLKSINEFYTIRLPLTHGGQEFFDLALNKNVIAVIKNLISGKFILNQQNGIINPPQETYNQRAWHRDLPYQHFVSTKPLAINALFCVDDFTSDNGATFVLPASHLSEAFPSLNYIQKNAIQIEAKAGFYILLDCMTFHCGGINRTGSIRRAVNHLYSIPYIKQQINIPLNMQNKNYSDDVREILGFYNSEPTSIEEYFAMRKSEY